MHIIFRVSQSRNYFPDTSQPVELEFALSESLTTLLEVYSLISRTKFPKGGGNCNIRVFITSYMLYNVDYM